MEYIVLLLLATFVLADYYIDNANTSVVYSMPATQSGQGWKTLSVNTVSLSLGFSNSTGNYSILLDASYCYEQNYALGVCGTADNGNCFVQIPFTGSGITMYVFNAGLSGMTASFSIDGGQAVTNTIQAPPPPTYQVSNVSLYDIQGLATGNHIIKMTPLDWGGGATSMKFDYAHVNETFVATPTTSSSESSVTSTSAPRTSSQPPTQIPTGNAPNINIGGITGAALGGLALCAILVIGVVYLRRRRTKSRPVSAFQVDPLLSEYSNSASLSSPKHEGTPTPITSRMRSAILRDALVGRSPIPSTGMDTTRRTSSISSAQSSVYPPSQGTAGIVDGVMHTAEVGSPPKLLGSEMAARYQLTTAQVEVVDRLRRNNVPPNTVAHVIEGFVATNLAGRELIRQRSLASAAPPPSYQSDG